MNEVKKKPSFALRFTIILLSIVFVYSSVFAGSIYFYVKNNPEPVYDPAKQTVQKITNEQITQRDNENVASGGVLGNVITPPVRTNFLIVGVDKNEGLTDSIMVGTFVSTTNELKLMSIPRDTYVQFRGENLKNLRSVRSSAPSVMKINAINVYGGKKEGILLLKSYLEELLGIKIDYYIKVNLDAFKEIVDNVGGIDFDVPENLYYSDPTQGLYINLKKGPQHLDGGQCEGLVRFRKGYAQQDLQRVKVQQEFMKEFFKQALAKESIRNNIGQMIATYVKHVTTNFTLDDSPKYIKCIQNLDVNNIESTTLPGYAQTIDGASYYIHDEAETAEVVNEYFYGNTSKKKATETTTTDEKTSETTTAKKKK